MNLGYLPKRHQNLPRIEKYIDSIKSRKLAMTDTNYVWSLFLDTFPLTGDLRVLAFNEIYCQKDADWGHSPSLDNENTD